MTNKKEVKRLKSRVKPNEFLEIMSRIKMIDEEIEAETNLYNVKIKSLELEKEYLQNQLQPK